MPLHFRSGEVRKKVSTLKPSVFLAVVLLFSASAFAATLEVSQSEMKDAWPFTVDRGTLRCMGGLVTFEANGKTYGVNGSAKTKGRVMGWIDVVEIWRSNPSIPGTKISISPVITKGLELCK